MVDLSPPSRSKLDLYGEYTCVVSSPEQDFTSHLNEVVRRFEAAKTPKAGRRKRGWPERPFLLDPQRENLYSNINESFEDLNETDVSFERTKWLDSCPHPVLVELPRAGSNIDPAWWEKFETPNLAWAWDLLIPEIVRRILDDGSQDVEPENLAANGFLPVPYIADARQYNLACLVVRLKHDYPKLRAVKPSWNYYCSLGPIRHWITDSSLEFEESILDGCKRVGSICQTTFIFRLSHGEGEQKKEIEIIVDGNSPWRWIELEPDQIQLAKNRFPNLVHKSMQSVYIVDQVIYAHALSIRLQIGKKSKAYDMVCVPIAFRMTEYRVGSWGRILGTQGSFGAVFPGHWKTVGETFRDYGVRTKDGKVLDDMIELADDGPSPGSVNPASLLGTISEGAPGQSTVTPPRKEPSEMDGSEPSPASRPEVPLPPLDETARLWHSFMTRTAASLADTAQKGGRPPGRSWAKFSRKFQRKGGRTSRLDETQSTIYATDDPTELDGRADPSRAFLLPQFDETDDTIKEQKQDQESTLEAKEQEFATRMERQRSALERLKRRFASIGRHRQREPRQRSVAEEFPGPPKRRTYSEELYEAMREENNSIYESIPVAGARRLESVSRLSVDTQLIETPAERPPMVPETAVPSAPPQGAAGPRRLFSVPSDFETDDDYDDDKVLMMMMKPSTSKSQGTGKPDEESELIPGDLVDAISPTLPPTPKCSNIIIRPPTDDLPGPAISRPLPPEPDMLDEELITSNLVDTISSPPKYSSIIRPRRPLRKSRSEGFPADTLRGYHFDANDGELSASWTIPSQGASDVRENGVEVVKRPAQRDSWPLVPDSPPLNLGPAFSPRKEQ